MGWSDPLTLAMFHRVFQDIMEIFRQIVDAHFMNSVLNKHSSGQFELFGVRQSKSKEKSYFWLNLSSFHYFSKDRRFTLNIAFCDLLEKKKWSNNSFWCSTLWNPQFYASNKYSRQGVRRGRNFTDFRKFTRLFLWF